MNYDVFVSYSKQDKVVADAVVSALEHKGIRCWYAPRDIKPSADWGDSITEAISECKIVLLIFSKNSNQSQRVRDEVYFAISEEKVILPFRIENLDPTGAMRLHLSSRHWLDAYQPSWQAHIDGLVSSIADTMGRPLVQPAAREKPAEPVPHPLPEERKKVPWLWIGLAVVAITALSVGGVLWFGSRDGINNKLPTEISASLANDVAASTEAAKLLPTMTSTVMMKPTTTPDLRIKNPVNNHFYLFVDENKSWHEARDYCNEQGGYLASVQDAAENLFIYSLSKGNSWLGATDEVVEGHWIWTSNEPWEYSNWLIGQPDNSEGEEHYLEFFGNDFPFQWNDANAATDVTRPFVCEWATPSSFAVKMILVTSAEDSGENTLRQALLDARAGNTIVFDPYVFPPGNPTTILVTSGLPIIQEGFITLDASNAGVTLDGSQAGGEWTAGIEVNSNYNVIKGLQVVHFSGPGLLLNETALFNIIGGDRSNGTGPLGEGNLFSDTSDGIAILGSYNLITGNMIGTDSTGTSSMGNLAPGIFLEENSNGNFIGPDNVIAFNGINGGGGVEIRSIKGTNIITANTIYENQSQGIQYNINEDPPFTYSAPPLILYYDLERGLLHGNACPGCIIEIFSTDTEDGKIYEGQTWSDENGYFVFEPGRSLTGPYLTATSRSPGESTSEFSLASWARNDILLAYKAIQNKEPFYQTGFDSWDFAGQQSENVKITNGKLIITSFNREHVGFMMNNLKSDNYAVEFDFHFSEAAEEGHCGFETSNDKEGEKTRRINVIFTANGRIVLGHFVYPDQSPDLINRNYDVSIANKVTLVFLGDQIAAFMNGQLAYALLNPDGSVNFSRQGFMGSSTIACEFDNYKLWDLSGFDLNP
jgi:hypothetical protein